MRHFFEATLKDKHTVSLTNEGRRQRAHPIGVLAKDRAYVDQITNE